MAEEKLLVYVGANKGDGLLSTLSNNPGSFTHAYVFEPDPEMFQILVHRYKTEIEYYRNSLGINTEILFVNAACSDITGRRTLYVFKNRVATSLGNSIPVPEQIIKTVEVEVINLYNFLTERGVKKIDYLLTDAQGSDLAILKTMKSYIDSKSINTIYTETLNDTTEWYEGLDNSYSGFKALLSLNYDVAYFDDHYNNQRHTNENILINAKEWDTCWTVKNK